VETRPKGDLVNGKTILERSQIASSPIVFDAEARTPVSIPQKKRDPE
jgi:hypothetical protein